MFENTLGLLPQVDGALEIVEDEHSVGRTHSIAHTYQDVVWLQKRDIFWYHSNQREKASTMVYFLYQFVIVNLPQIDMLC